MELFSSILFFDINYLTSIVKNKLSWRSYLLTAILFFIIGLVSSMFVQIDKLSRTVIVCLVSFGSLFTFLGTLLLSYLVFTVLRLFMNFDITSKMVKDISLIGTIPILLNNVINTIMNGFFGMSPNGYVSLNHFFQSQNKFLNNFFQSINPFYIWSWMLVSIIFFKLTCSEFKFKGLPLIYALIFLGIKILLG